MTQKRTLALAVGAAVMLLLPTASRADEKKPAPGAEKKESKMVKTPSGLQYEDTKVGEGVSPKTGQTCVMHYTGWLWVNEARGKKFDSSVDRGEPFEFAIGRGQVIKGWDEGVATMKVGGKRTLVIPPGLAYGDRNVGGGLIPAGSTLVFDVELLGVK